MDVIPSTGGNVTLGAAFLVMLCQVLALNDLFCSQALHGAPAPASPRDGSRCSSFLPSAPWGWAGYMAVPSHLPSQRGFSVPVKCQQLLAALGHPPWGSFSCCSLALPGAQAGG